MSKKNKKRSAPPRKQSKKTETKELVITIIGAVLVLALVVGLIVAAVLGSRQNTQFTSGTSGKVTGPTYGQPESPVFDETLKGTPTHNVTIQVKNYGTITMQLYGYLAPKTVENFVSLIEEGFYDGLTFHRIISGFMIQGGCPNGDGTGGSDEDIPGEFTSNGYENPLAHTRGVVSMARSSDPNSASSQFFIMHDDAPHLDGDYAAFGFVTSGMEVVDAICNAAQPIDGNGSIAKANQPIIESITVTAISE